MKDKREFARQMREKPTPSERALWSALRGRGFRGLAFRRQVQIMGWIVDFYCEAHRLVVEIDGDYHDHKEDERRDAAMRAKGYKIVRVRSRLVLSDLERALDRIRWATGGIDRSDPSTWPENDRRSTALFSAEDCAGLVFDEVLEGAE